MRAGVTPGILNTMTSAATPPSAPPDGYIAGVRLLLRGFGRWRVRPGQMSLGLIPPAIAGALTVAALATLAAFLPGIVTALTPFADGWTPVWMWIARIALGAAILAGAGAIGAVSFTAVTLLIGEPFYDRIWKGVETDASGSPPEAPYGFWRGIGDAIALIARGVGVGLLAALVGLIPVVGAPVAWVLGVWLTGLVLADELSSRALVARGIGRRERRRMLRAHRGLTTGFGVATQLCFLVPLGAIAVMPAAVAGSTYLAHALLAHEARTVAP